MAENVTTLTFADRLSAARRERFVGRTAELTSLRSVLFEAKLPFQILFIFGPGGVGKTTLLREYTYLCHQTQTPVSYIDAQSIDPTPEAFLSALPFAPARTQPGGPTPTLPPVGRQVLLIDSYEALTSLDEWFREVFLPQLPGDVLVVLASRLPPASAWRADPGWQTLLHTLSLRNLSPEESRLYLNKRDIPVDQHQVVLQFTHGHPLALSLIADLFSQHSSTRFQPEATQDVVKILMGHLVQRVPGPAHRAALEACATVRMTTEGLLQEMVGTPDAHELFEWLRELSFIESGPFGLFPHDLAREVLVADLRWRNPDWYAELHRRARTYYANHSKLGSGQEQERILMDYIFLHRDSPIVRPFFTPLEEQSGASATTVWTDMARDADIPGLVTMVAQHEGEGSARFAKRWLPEQPQGVLVFRDAQPQLAGMLVMVSLHQADAEDLNADPATQAAWSYLEHHAPLRPGEGATIFRFWMAKDTYQGVSPIQSLIFVNMVRHYLTIPGLAFTFLPCSQPDFWAPFFSYADLTRIPEADFEVDGRRYGVYGHDWRLVSPTAWLNLLAQRETAMAPHVQPPSTSSQAVVLSEAGFAESVRKSLQHFSRPDVMATNPLVDSRLVRERCGPESGRDARIATLQELVREGAESLRQSPREEKLYLTLYHTYFHPAPSQERAAELLDLPFSTYRRHLKTAIARVTAMLWQLEIGPWAK